MSQNRIQKFSRTISADLKCFDKICCVNKTSTSNPQCHKNVSKKSHLRKFYYFLLLRPPNRRKNLRRKCQGFDGITQTLQLLNLQILSFCH